jgi:Fic family protein
MTWPAVAYEHVPWDAEPERASSRRQQLRARGPYSAAVPPFIAELSPSIPGPLAAEAADAQAALTAFDARVGEIPAPFAAILLRTESASSSEIERLTAGAKAIAQAELGRKAGANAELIVANVRAMQSALELADDLSVDTVVAMQDALLSRHHPDLVGLRAEAVWIGGGLSNAPHTAEFVPPHHERVPALMADVMTFARRTDLLVLPHLAIAHAQFETIHPFADGNGRTGRALVQAMLRHHRVTRSVTVPVSAGLLTRTGDYVDALTAYRAGDIEPIIEQFIAATWRSIDNADRLVTGLLQLRMEWETRVDARRGSGARHLLDLLASHPVIDVPRAAELLGVAYTSAAAAIERLEVTGVLTPLSDAARNRAWVANGMIELLDTFAARARRRSPRA